MKANPTRDAVILSTCAVAGAIATPLIAAPATGIGIATAAVIGGVACGAILPPLGIVGYFLAKGLKDYLKNDGLKIAAIGLLMTVGALKTIFVTPIRAFKSVVQKLFPNAKPKETTKPKAADAPASLTSAQVVASFNAEATPLSQPIQSTPTSPPPTP